MMNRVLSVLISLVVIYGLLVVPAFYPGFDLPTILSQWATKTTTTNNDENPALQEVKDESAPPTNPVSPKPKKKLSALELKFAIDGPIVHQTSEAITLDYQVGDWVTFEYIQYQFFDFDCQEPLEDAASNSLPVRALAPEKLVEVEEHSFQVTKEQDDEEEGEKVQKPSKSTWRLALELKRNDEEEDSPSVKVAGKHNFCVRWMLFNMPTSSEYAMEVTFERTQLAIEIDDQGQIATVDVSTPEPVGVQVHVNGRGTAYVQMPEGGSDEL